MPRPRVGKTRPANNRTGPQRVAKHVPTITRDEVHQHLAAKKIGHVVLSNSDDSDELVIAQRGLRNRSNIPRREIYGSGGLGKEDMPLAHKKASTKIQAGAGKRVKSRTPSTAPNATSNINKANPLATSSPLTSIPSSTPPKSILKSPSGTTNSQPATVARNNAEVVQARPTPGIDRSFLTGLKPRKRQPSLLSGLRQDVNDHGDSSIEFSGLDEFDDIVPNDESTPINSNKASTPAQVSSAASQKPSSIIGRKRKITPVTPASEQSSRVRQRVSDARSSPQLRADRRASIDLLSSMRSDIEDEPALPDNLSHGPRDDDDLINAPPESSSSPVQSPQKALARMQDEPQQSHPSSIKKKQTRRNHRVEPSKMTTEALQALLPSRRGQEKGRFHGRDEFDIPSDPSQEAASNALDEDDETSFLPAKRPRKTTMKKNATMKTGLRRGKAGRKQSPVQEEKPMKNKKGPNPIQATPLQEVSTRAAAKPLQQQGKKKITYSSRHLDISEGDKENQPFDMSDGSFSHSNSVVDGAKKETSIWTGTASSKREKEKWDAIDAFEMEFESRSPDDLASSSPLG